MQIIFLSEHYIPRIGGVTTYVKNTCLWFSHLGHDVTLLIPGEHSHNTEQSIFINDHYKEVYLGLGAPLNGNIASQMRMNYIKASEKYLKNEVEFKNVDVIHILFGLYTMYYLDIPFFQKKGISLGVTIHNIPPAECAISWKEEGISKYTKDKVRLFGVGYINKKRIRKYRFDYYITPSEHVRKLLNEYVVPDKIFVIGHGLDSTINFNKKLSLPSERIRITMVGGFVPHKRQHYIIDIAKSLIEQRFDLDWYLVGPIRNKVYHKYVVDKIEKYGLENVKIKSNIPNEELHELYLKSDIYVQPSTEEGFCMTVLDAAAFGLPIVGTKTGAIPEIISDGSGLITGFSRLELESSLKEMIKNISEFEKDAVLDQTFIIQKYTWLSAAQQLEQIIKESGVNSK